jgi:hypothetical protein
MVAAVAVAVAVVSSSMAAHLWSLPVAEGALYTAEEQAPAKILATASPALAAVLVAGWAAILEARAAAAAAAAAAVVVATALVEYGAVAAVATAAMAPVEFGLPVEAVF